MAGQIRFYQRGWDELIGHVLDTEGVARMSRVANACNTDADTDEFLVSVQGSKPLRKRDFRVTVITAGAQAMRHNRANNTLLRNFHLASGS